MEVDIPSIRQSAAEDGVACQFDKCGRSRPMFRRMSDLVPVVSDNHQAGYAPAWFRRSPCFVSKVRFSTDRKGYYCSSSSTSNGPLRSNYIALKVHRSTPA